MYRDNFKKMSENKGQEIRKKETKQMNLEGTKTQKNLRKKLLLMMLMTAVIM